MTNTGCIYMPSIPVSLIYAKVICKADISFVFNVNLKMDSMETATNIMIIFFENPILKKYFQ